MFLPRCTSKLAATNLILQSFLGMSGENSTGNMAAPPAGFPESPEAQFLAQSLGAALARGLAEVAEKRPMDPIEYLAHYLHAYKANCIYYEKVEEWRSHISFSNNVAILVIS